MPGARVDNSPKVTERKRDITSWQEESLSRLSSRDKKRYNKRKSALQEYFTTYATPKEIAGRYQLSTSLLLELVEKSLKRHKDGMPWGYRALIPGVKVVNYAPKSEAPHENVAKSSPVAEPQEPDTPDTSDTLDASDTPEPQLTPITSASNEHSLTEAEQLVALVEENTELGTHKELDTGKREAINLSQMSHVPNVPSVSPAFTLSVPETPLPECSPESELDTIGEESELLPQVEAEQSELAEEALAEEGEGDERTVRLPKLVESETGIAFPETEPEAQAQLAELTDPKQPEESEAEASSSEDERTVRLPKLVENETGIELTTLEPVAPDAIEETLAEPLITSDTTEISDTSDTTDTSDTKDTIEPTWITTGSETVSNESARAISEAERLLAEEQELAVVTQDEATPIAVGDITEAEILPASVRVEDQEVPLSFLVPTYTQGTAYPIGKHVVQHRLVRKHWSKEVRGHKKQRRLLQVVSLSIVAAILIFVMVPVGAGFAAYSAYSNISGIAHDGINHLLKVKSLLPISKSDPTAALNAPKLQQAQKEFTAAEGDFTQLQQLVDRPDVQAAITQFAPQYATKLGMAQSLLQVALDVSRMGYELSGVGLIGANIIHGSPLASGSTKPVISVADVSAIEGAMVHALYYISDIRAQMSQVSINEIPISASQKAQLASVMALLPQAESMITQAQGLEGLVSWLLGVGGQRRFLVQTMDRAELRPGGGFTGQYGILQIKDGRMSPFTLTDVTLIDYAENGTAIGRTAPPGYSWMNFGNWGVRDSNLSGDFPTTARMTMQLYQDEGGGPIDGDIAFTPVLIAHILDVIGPIKVPGYNETITSKNLEDRLHYWQQNQTAIAHEKQISGNYTHAGRKAFTSAVGQLLLDRVRHAPVKELIAIAKNAIKDIQSRDLEIYFSNPAAESWLVQHGYSGTISTFSGEDGFMVVQANISISKASQYVHTTEQDQVTLDAQGGATHNLTITLDYQQKGPVYGFDTYADYIRVYAPPGAQFQGGDGFDTGQALCKPSGGTPTPKPTGTGGTPTPVPTPVGCSQYNSYFPSNARYCPNGDYALGLNGNDHGRYNVPWAIDSLGAPTELTSDLPGRSMWGGLTETPKNCISYISLSWYVPHAVQKVNGQPVYNILIQKQSGYSPTIQLSIDASAIKGLKSFNFNGDIITDRMFTITVPVKKK